MSEPATKAVCRHCGKQFDLAPVNLPGGVRIRRTNPSVMSGGERIDFCSKPCHKESDIKTDCLICGAHYKAKEHMEKDVLVENVKCPGCCGPVVSSYFCDEEDPFTSYTCGAGFTKVGPHGSLAYIRPGDKRPLQQAINEEFEKRQAARDKNFEEFKARGKESVTREGCFPGVTVTSVPTGRLPVKTHGVDCYCVKKDLL